jgi:hypothetical protein
MTEAVTGDGVLQRGSSWLGFESKPFLLDDALENNDLVFDMLVLAYTSNASCMVGRSIPLHGAWNVGHESVLSYSGHATSSYTRISPETPNESKIAFKHQDSASCGVRKQS